MRLIDLHVDWLLQYATESVVFDPFLYPDVRGRQEQAVAYLQTCRAAILSCYRKPEDWVQQSDPWGALGQLLTRVEAEFPGRLLIDSDDFSRFQEDREGLTWGMIGVEGFDFLVRTENDLDRLSGLFDRGVRLFQLVSHENNLLGGSLVNGDDRGLTSLGIAFLERLTDLPTEQALPILDLSGLNSRTISEALNWFESSPTRSGRLILSQSQGSSLEAVLESPAIVERVNLTRLRALGGFIGLSIAPPFVHSSQRLEQAVGQIASIPFQGRLGFEGIAISTSFLGLERTLPGLSNADEVVTWFQERFDRPVAKDLLHDNALSLLSRATGSTNRS